MNDISEKEISDLAHAAVRGACKGKSISPEDRWDIAQEMLVDFFAHEPPIQEPKSWFYVVAYRHVVDFLESEKLHRDLLEQLHVVGSRPYNRRLTPEPGVEYMAIKPSKRTSGKNDVEDALIAAIDARARSGQGPKRKSVAPQEQMWFELLQINRKRQKGLVRVLLESCYI